MFVALLSIGWCPLFYVRRGVCFVVCLCLLWASFVFFVLCVVRNLVICRVCCWLFAMCCVLGVSYSMCC